MNTKDAQSTRILQWMKQLFISNSFSRLADTDLDALLRKIETFHAKAGETIIRQGETGDFFYIVTEGTCRLVNNDSVMEKTRELVSLGPGTSFGEEAIIRGGARNATVEMFTDGILARIGRDDFDQLIRKPLLRGFLPPQVQQMALQGAKLLDVRDVKEAAELPIPKSRTLPISSLRGALNTLPKDANYIVCSNSEQESALGAFILALHNFNACYLSGDVEEYLSLTGDYKEPGLDVPGGGGDFIELPEEYTAPGAKPISISEPRFGASEHALDNTSLNSLMQTLKHGIEQILDQERKKHAQEIQTLKEKFQAKLERKTKEIDESYNARYQAKKRSLREKYEAILKQQQS